MTTYRKFDSAFKTLAFSAVAALMLSACNGDAKPTSSPDGQRSAYEHADDHALGDPGAPITVVEYASVTCAHCANWHTTVWEDFRKEFVDTNEVRYVFREFPTQPVELAMAGHLIANCAPEDQFFPIIGVQMKRQREILSSKDIKGEYVGLAKMAGMNEEQFEACLSNQDEKERLAKVIDEGFNAGVTGTPTFFVNGKKESVYTIDDFRKKFAQILGKPVPETATEDSAETSEH